MKTTTFVIGAVCALVLGLILGWAGRGLLTYPTSSATDTAFQDWRLVCPAAIQKDGSCQMTDDLLDSKSHQEVARLIMGKEKGALVLGITLPLGVSLEPGVGLVIGKDPMKIYAYRTCAQIGCVAVLPVDVKLLTSMQQAKDASIVFAGQDGKPIKLGFNMNGFADAQRAFNRNEVRRASWFWRMWS